MSKLSYEHIKEYIEKEQGYTLLSEDHEKKGYVRRIRLLCPKKHEYDTTWGNFQQGHRCPYCAGKRVTYQQVKDYIKQQGYILLSEKYRNAHSKLDIECPEKHQYQVKWNDFQQGHRCPYCAGLVITCKQVKKYIEQQGYTLLSQKYQNSKTKLNIQCDEGHTYNATWGSFQQGQRCPYCYGNARLTYQQVEEHIRKQGYGLLSKEYKNWSTKLSIECSKKHHFKATWDKFRQGHRCPRCKESKGEKRIATILTDFNLFFISQYRLGKGRRALRLDFYIPSLSLGIEYDGEHHLRPVRFKGVSLEKAEQNFKKIQERDRRKNQICADLGIRLLRIGHTDDVQSKIESLRWRFDTNYI